MINKSRIIQETVNFVKKRLNKEASGHDWWHIYRVWKMAIKIAKTEKADLFVVELASLLHDIADWKMYSGDERIGPKIAQAWLEKQKVDKETVSHVCQIIQTMTFKGAKVKIIPMKTVEGKIVQDADRLDAIGVIGIARTFTFGGHKGRPMWDPNVKPKLHTTAQDYIKKSHNTINHFYEKLLLLKDRMNTETAKKIAEGRHKVMEDFLQRFYKEWEGIE